MSKIRWTIYIPDEVKANCEAAAERESKATDLNVSVNGWVVRALKRQLESDDQKKGVT